VESGGDGLRHELGQGQAFDDAGEHRRAHGLMKPLAVGAMRCKARMERGLRLGIVEGLPGHCRANPLSLQ